MQELLRDVMESPSMDALSSGSDKQSAGVRLNSLDNGEMQLLVCGDMSRSPSNPFEMIAFDCEQKCST